MTGTISTDTIIIALSKLDTDPQNVRKTRSDSGVRELAASIKANGLLQNPVVRPGSKKGRYFVTAGARRFAALRLLADSGDIAADAPIECRLYQGGNATEVSLAENTVREAMNPADEFEAFARLAAGGHAAADIAIRFGTTEAIVRKRLALGRVSPVLIQLFRNEEMRFDQLSAFTVSDDHAEQERVWSALPAWSRHPNDIRAGLTGGAIRSCDKRVRFIGGLDAHEAAGGSVRRDLFDEDSGLALDIVVLETLVCDKLEAIAAEVAAEGWLWTEVVPLADYAYLQQFDRHYAKQKPLTDAEQVELDCLQAERDALDDLIEDGETDPEAEARLSSISARVGELGLDLRGPRALLDLQPYNTHMFIESILLPKAGLHVPALLEGRLNKICHAALSVDRRLNLCPSVF